MTSRTTKITLAKEYQKFSAAHFTIFSATERERLHGHNFSVAVAITVPVGDDGLCFSYRIYKDILKSICEELDEFTLLPGLSPYLSLTEEGNYILAQFNGERHYYLRSDTRILPIRNTTVEEFSAYILGQLLKPGGESEALGILAIEVQVFSGPGQSGSADWNASDPIRA